MLFDLLMLAGQGFNVEGAPPPASVPNPVIGVVSVAMLSSGSCTDNLIFGGDLVSPASLRVSWSIANPDTGALNFKTQVFENGNLVAELPSTAVSWDKTVPGVVQLLFTDIGWNSFTANWVYEVRAVAIDGGVGVSSSDSDAWTARYGTCSP